MFSTHTNNRSVTQAAVNQRPQRHLYTKAMRSIPHVKEYHTHFLSTSGYLYNISLYVSVCLNVGHRFLRFRQYS